MHFEPCYLRTYESGELERRVEEALRLLADCTACPRDCHVNRLADEKAICRSGRYAVVSSYFPHFGEEDCLRGWNGSGTIFFSHCNLRCVFCFSPETPIATDRDLIRIADLFELGEDEVEWHGGQVRFLDGKVRVYTRHGELAPVTKAFRHSFAGELVSLKPCNCPPLLLTPNHEVFAAHRSAPDRITKVRADSLTKDHFLVAPERVPFANNRGKKWKATDDSFLVPLHRVERLPYEGWVFNLEVDDPDHSYLAPFVAVSNCQNYDISHDGQGRMTPPEELAWMMLNLQRQGCHNINFVTPEHVVPQILEGLLIAVRGGLRLPLVYNTSAYDSLESLRLMDGVVDVYMPDLKYWCPDRAQRYLKARDYPDAARAALKEMHRQVGDLILDEHALAKRGLMVRHLVMPEGLEDTRHILRWIAEEISPDTYVNVMAQYHPAGKVSHRLYPEINRRLTSEEYAAALDAARAAGLRRLDPRWRRHLGGSNVVWAEM